MQQHWSEIGIEKAADLTRAFEVMKAWLAHAANFVLFFCMIANIVQVVVKLPDGAIGVVIIVEAVALDVAGLGLFTLAKHARSSGMEKEAGRASVTAWALILIMIATIATVTTAKLWPETADTMRNIDNFLILVRVCLIVVYGVVTNALHEHHIVAPKQAEAYNALEMFTDKIEGLQAVINDLPQQIAPLPIIEPESKETTVIIRPIQTSSLSSDDVLGFGKLLSIVGINGQERATFTEPITEPHITIWGSVKGSVNVENTEPSSEPFTEPWTVTPDGSVKKQNTEPLSAIKLITPERKPVNLGSVPNLLQNPTANRKPAKNDAENKVRKLLKKNPSATLSEIMKETGFSSKSYVSSLRKKVLSELQVVSA